MRDRPPILAGLALFLLVATFPVWYNVTARTSAASPVLARAVGTPSVPAKPGQCVAPVDEMRASHMVLLRTWREEVVRTGRRAYTTQDGRQYAKSLTGTCLTCHDRKTEFCDRCHDYAGVTSVCMDCHVDPDARRAPR
jgi:hypothetical protein